MNLIVKHQSAALVLDDLDSFFLVDDFEVCDDVASFDFLAAALSDFALLA